MVIQCPIVRRYFGSKGIHKQVPFDDILFVKIQFSLDSLKVKLYNIQVIGSSFLCGLCNRFTIGFPIDPVS